MGRLGLGDVFIDVGANIGFFTVHVARRVGREGRVMAIEPSRVVFSYLEKNTIETNLVDNVTALNVAASDQNRRARGCRSMPPHRITLVRHGRSGATVPPRALHGRDQNARRDFGIE